MSLARPPVVAEELLTLLVPPDRFESISGDLLEQYRDEKLPALGPRRAGLWYLRQVGAYFLRASWPFLLLLVAAFIARDLYNTFLNTDSVTNARMQRLFGWVFFPSLFMAGVHGGRTTGQAAGGALIAAGTQLLVWVTVVVWTIATFHAFLPVMEQRAWWIAAWHYSGNGESFERWLIEDNIGGLLFGGSLFMIAATVLGVLGGALGTRLRPRRRRSA
jgi:hypothetical protein